jgi:predicted HTH transcriptional regulator
MPQNQIIERGVQRKDEYFYPVEALREGIVNVVAHRNK